MLLISKATLRLMQRQSRPLAHQRAAIGIAASMLPFHFLQA